MWLSLRPSIINSFQIELFKSFCEISCVFHIAIYNISQKEKKYNVSSSNILQPYLGQIMSCRLEGTKRDNPLDLWDILNMLWFKFADEKTLQADFHFFFCWCIQKCSVDLNHLKPEHDASPQSTQPWLIVKKNNYISPLIETLQWA